jgi:2-C-methyl-D-erythritol 4-phosphate cytidylyltransferase
VDGIVADAVVVAAGRSERMGGRDKLAAELAGRPCSPGRWPRSRRRRSSSASRSSARRAGGRATPGLAAEKVVASFAGGARRQESVAAGSGARGALPRPAVATAAARSCGPRWRARRS